jgi:hypothetical protein
MPTLAVGNGLPAIAYPANKFKYKKIMSVRERAEVDGEQARVVVESSRLRRLVVTLIERDKGGRASD